MIELTLNTLSKTYANGVHALREVNLNLKRGMFGLLGPNGAGKSSLMRTIATLQDPDQGNILFNGKNIADDKQAFRRRLGYLPQDFGVYPNVSALDLLDYFARLKGISNARQRKAQVEHLLETVNLTAAKDKAVDTFSGGMRQRFGIAQTLIGKPEVIIVDEPTAGLDPAERNRFYGILHNLGDDAIVILSTHIIGDVTHLCQDMAIMSGGAIQARGTPGELLAQLEGKLWRKNIGHEDLTPYRQNHQLIRAALHQGEIAVVIYAEQDPGDGFSPKQAELEDVYFSHIREA